MTSNGRKYFSGGTLEQALMQAARYHGIKPEEVAYRKIEKRHGFLRARKSVVIEVDPEAPMLTADEPVADVIVDSSPEVVASDTAHIAEEETTTYSDAVPEIEEPTDEGEEAVATRPEPEEQVEPPTEIEAAELEESVEDNDDLIGAARRGLKEILDFAKLDLESEVRQGEGQLDIELRGPDRDRLLEDRGNLLLSIQHLLPRLIRGYSGRSTPCHVDSENFHETRQAELKKLAEEAAQEVRRRQRPRTLPPMNPAERRIIHITLADDAEVVTESQGKGFYKRVMIRPAIRRPRGFDRYSR